ncbi:MAG TPA: toll/interleukin-1 receptor domain-containing protein, partial [Candidatus Eisenbacteria bacterium]|nr:toll/interleukin-1 receptor domain-containing protein [Candidatus Eisenbacteria bacterium]
MAHDVFISHAAEDKPTGDAVCAALEGRGIRCWIAPRDVTPGIAFPEAIITAINASRVMVLVFSSRSNTSPHVMREVERAVNRGIPIIPLRIEDVPLSPSMEYFISTPHWLDALTPPLRKHLRHLADTVGLLLAQAGAVRAQGLTGGVIADPGARAAVGAVPEPAGVSRPRPRAESVARLAGRPVGLMAVAAVVGIVAIAWTVLRAWDQAPASSSPGPSGIAVVPSTRPSRGLEAPVGPSSNQPEPGDSPDSGSSQPVAADVIVETVGPLPGTTGAGLAWDATNLWVSGSSEIFKTDAAGRVLGVYTPPDYTPEGITWDGSQLWLFTTDTSTVYRFSVKETSQSDPPRVISSFAAPNRQLGAIAHALAWDGSELWLSDDYSIYELDTSGQVLRTLAFGQVVAALAADGSGLWIVFDNWPDGATLVATDFDGNELASFSTPLVEVVSMVWVDDHLLVA